MNVISSESAFTGKSSVVALGMFDGVHIGHQKLIREAVNLAKRLDAQCVVCTFDRHPLSVVRPDMAPEALLTLEENIRKFEALGAEWTLVKSFTAAFAAISPEDFLKELCENMRVAGIVAGENYTFGSRGRGNARMLLDMQQALNYTAVIVPPVMDGEDVASSTLIRRLLKEGDTERVNRLMGISPQHI